MLKFSFTNQVDQLDLNLPRRIIFKLGFSLLGRRLPTLLLLYCISSRLAPWRRSQYTVNSLKGLPVLNRGFFATYYDE